MFWWYDGRRYLIWINNIVNNHCLFVFFFFSPIANKLANKSKIYFGLLKEPELNIQVTADDDADETTIEDGSERPKKKKLRKETISKKSRNDPNAPALTRIPLPELRDIDKLEKINALKESAKRLKLSPNSLPSICFYTLLNSNSNQSMALCVDISEDSYYIAAGFSNSVIKVWPLTPQKLKMMRPSNQLEIIDKESDDVLARMMDGETTFDKKVLHGHSGPVYSINFSPDKTLLISCSEDSTSKFFQLILIKFNLSKFFFLKFVYGVCRLGQIFVATKDIVFLVIWIYLIFSKLI